MQSEHTAGAAPTPTRSFGSWLSGLFGGGEPKPQALAAPPPSKKAAANVRSRALGGTGTAIYAGFLHDLDKNSEVRGTKWYGEPGVLGIASQMMRDAHVRRSFNTITKPVRAAVWDFKPASDDPLDIEVADFCRWAFLEKLNWDEVIRGAQYYIRDGFSLLEVTDDVDDVPRARFPKHPGRGKGIVVTGFHQRVAASLFRWQAAQDNTAQIDGIHQWLQGTDSGPIGQVFIPADRLLRFTYEQEAGNYAGLSLLRSAYGAWKTKLTFLVLDAIRNERQAVGVPRISLPEDATEEDIAQARVILSEMRSNEKGYIILPFGFDFAWETASTEGQASAIAECIERCNRDIAYNVGAGFQLLGLTGNSGSYALAQTQAGQYEIELDTEARFLTGVFNHGSDGWTPTRRIVDLNYGTNVAAPLCVARNMPTRDWTKSLPVINNLITQGAVRVDKPLRAHVREVMYLPPEDPATLEDRPQIGGQTPAATAPPPAQDQGAQP